MRLAKLSLPMVNSRNIYMKISKIKRRRWIIAGGFTLVVILYLTVWKQAHKQEEISTPKILNGTLQSPKHLETQATIPVSNRRKQQAKDVKNATAEEQSKFSVADRGFWQGLGATKQHLFDRPLAAAIIQFLKDEGITSVLEFGCGTGTYAKLIKAEGIEIHCYDGNPETQILSEGRCSVVDLSKPLDFSKSDFVLSLEVGEHIPKEYEDIFISNLDKSNRRGIILSWAVEFQGGMSHVNQRNNSYIRDKLVPKGYIHDLETEENLRKAAYMFWFKNSLMVFRRKIL